MTSAVGMIEALSGIIGEADGDIGGIHITRLTAVVTDGTPVSEQAELVWTGSVNVGSIDTTEFSIGDWIRLDADGQYFEIIDIIPNTYMVIDNPNGWVIPLGIGPSSIAVTSFPVETTLEFSDAGKISIDGVVYNYASKTNTSFDGITYLLGGETRVGALRQHRIESAVYDRNRDTHALDLVRRAMLVEYAEGEDLNALGRNLGVLRSAFLTGDDQFREIIKVLAYNPKGTVLGLELALAGLVGVGNFSIYEDLIGNPAKVFITLSAGAVISDIPLGATYLEETERILAGGLSTGTVQHALVERGAIESVHIADEYINTDTSAALPPSQTWTRGFPGAPTETVWGKLGGGAPATEAIQYTTEDGGATEAQGEGDQRLFYQHDTRVVSTSIARITLWIKLLDNGTGVPEANPRSQIVLLAQRWIDFGWTQNGSLMDMGFMDGLGVFAGSPVQLPVGDGAYHHLEIVHDGKAQEMRWYWDGVLQQTKAVTDYPVSSGHRIMWGVFGAPFVAFTGSAQWRVKNFRHQITSPTNYWAARGTDGSVSLGTRTLASASLTFQPSDVGKGFTTYDSQVVNAEGGNNNGRWLVESQGGTDVTLIGETWMGAVLQGVNPTRIILPLDQPLLQYPDDLGKEIEIIGSSLGNDGIYVIDKLLDPVTLTDIELGDTPTPVKTRYCEVIGATFLSETDLSWRLRPNFAAETNLPWQLEDAGSVVTPPGGPSALTLRQAMPSTLPAYCRVWDVTYAQVLSGQLLRDASVGSVLLSSEPLQMSYYPFYLADPLGYARDYLSSVTAAGVIPDFEIA